MADSFTYFLTLEHYEQIICFNNEECGRIQRHDPIFEKIDYHIKMLNTFDDYAKREFPEMFI